MCGVCISSDFKILIMAKKIIHSIILFICCLWFHFPFPLCLPLLITGTLSSVTSRGLSLYRGKKMTSLCDNVMNVYGKCRMYNKRKKHESLLVICSIILPSIYSKLAKIPAPPPPTKKTTKKIKKRVCMSRIGFLWLKDIDGSRNDQHLLFFHS